MCRDCDCYISDEMEAKTVDVRDTVAWPYLTKCQDFHSDTNEVLCRGEHFTVVSVTRSASTMVKFTVQPQAKFPPESYKHVSLIIVPCLPGTIESTVSSLGRFQSRTERLSFRLP